jgi:hypothetical protein
MSSLSFLRLHPSVIAVFLACSVILPGGSLHAAKLVKQSNVKKGIRVSRVLIKDRV